MCKASGQRWRRGRGRVYRWPADLAKRREMDNNSLNKNDYHLAPHGRWERLACTYAIATDSPSGQSSPPSHRAPNRSAKSTGKTAAPCSADSVRQRFARGCDEPASSWTRLAIPAMAPLTVESPPQSRQPATAGNPHPPRRHHSGRGDPTGHRNGSREQDSRTGGLPLFQRLMGARRVAQRNALPALDPKRAITDCGEETVGD